jgi:phosphopantothenoylcysteine decarboxylase/phosphopantothenate--cysteine ligase
MVTRIADKTVVLGVTGGIAAYKAAELCRLLVKAGAKVQVIMTEAACHFITPLTLQTLSGREVLRDLFAADRSGGVGHIEIAATADLLIVAPATADAVARFAAGLANDLLSAVVLATRAPILLAPAMNTNMWNNPLTQENLARLCREGRASTIGPDAGDLACGWVGAGRMVAPEEILAAAAERLGAAPARPAGAPRGSPGSLPGMPRPLVGRQVVVTAGPTWEAIDDVRFLGNRSSGKMGFALAEAAGRLGAEVTLIAGPVALPTPPRVGRRIDVESALDMRTALHKAVARADVVIMAAAVADFRPGVRVLGKLSRRSEEPVPPAGRAIPLVPNPDLLAELGRSRQGGRPYLVGFAAEVGARDRTLVDRAREKLVEKGCDVVVANEVGRPGLGFGADHNAVTLVFADSRVVELPPARKDQLAASIWDTICRELDAGEPPDSPAAEEPRSLRRKARSRKVRHG